MGCEGMKFQTATKDIDFRKLPPQNLEAEQAVLGSMLLDEEAVLQAVELIDESFFYKKTHAKIFQAIVRLFDTSKPVDLVTLSEELKNSGELEDIGGASYLATLAECVPTAANISHYAKIVKEKYILRSLINASTQIITNSFESEEKVDNILDKAEQIIFDIISRRIEVGFIHLKEIIKNSIETIDNLYQRKVNITGIPSGFIKFDEMTAGFQPSDLIVIAGRPSMGKSALSTCIAEYVGVINKVPVGIFSLEMSKEQLVQRMLCSHAKIDAHKVRTGYLSRSDWPKLTNAAGKLSESPIFIDDSPALTSLELRAKARRLKSRHNVNLIIIDYLQLMCGAGGSENRQQEISEISRSFKALARELSIPVIAISQLSRAVEARQTRRPQLSDLRESGAIEQDADVVVLIFREEYYGSTPENRGLAEIILAKQRNGPTGSIKLTFINEYARFENYTKIGE